MNRQTYGRKAADWERANRATAERVLEDVDAHGGEGAVTVQWARLVLRGPNDAPFELTAPGTHSRQQQRT